MNEHFLTYEQSLAVKELGYIEEHTFAYYSSDDKRLIQGYSISTNEDEVDAPLKSQFFKWAREKYKIHSHISITDDEDFKGKIYIAYVLDIEWLQDKEVHLESRTENNTYEQAEDACINRIIEILKLK